ncbi:MAG: hypothetical protein AAB518_03945 [Patescibacteria group bacterium]
MAKARKPARPRTTIKELREEIRHLTEANTTLAIRVSRIAELEGALAYARENIGQSMKAHAKLRVECDKCRQMVDVLTHQNQDLELIITNEQRLIARAEAIAEILGQFSAEIDVEGGTLIVSGGKTTFQRANPPSFG